MHSFSNKTMGYHTFLLHPCLPWPEPVHTYMLGCVNFAFDSQNNTRCLCLWCKALPFPKGLHFHGNQADRKERISAWNHSVLRNKAEHRPRASSEFSLWEPGPTVTLGCLRKTCSPLASAHEKTFLLTGDVLKARKAGFEILEPGLFLPSATLW